MTPWDMVGIALLIIISPIAMIAAIASVAILVALVSSLFGEGGADLQVRRERGKD